MLYIYVIVLIPSQLKDRSLNSIECRAENINSEVVSPSKLRILQSVGIELHYWPPCIIYDIYPLSPCQNLQEGVTELLYRLGSSTKYRDGTIYVMQYIHRSYYILQLQQHIQSRVFIIKLHYRNKRGTITLFLMLQITKN